MKNIIRVWVETPPLRGAFPEDYENDGQTDEEIKEMFFGNASRRGEIVRSIQRMEIEE